MNKLWIVPAIIIVGLVSFVFVSDYIPNRSDSFESTLGNQPTSESEYHSWVNEGCHPAIALNGTYYQVCNNGK